MLLSTAGCPLSFLIVTAASPFASAWTQVAQSEPAGGASTLSCAAPAPSSVIFQLPVPSGIAENCADPCGAMTSCAAPSIRRTEFALSILPDTRARFLIPGALHAELAADAPDVKTRMHRIGRPGIDVNELVTRSRTADLQAIAGPQRRQCRFGNWIAAEYPADGPVRISHRPVRAPPSPWPRVAIGCRAM